MHYIARQSIILVPPVDWEASSHPNSITKERRIFALLTAAWPFTSLPCLDARRCCWTTCWRWSVAAWWACRWCVSPSSWSSSAGSLSASSAACAQAWHPCTSARSPPPLFVAPSARCTSWAWSLASWWLRWGTATAGVWHLFFAFLMSSGHEYSKLTLLHYRVLRRVCLHVCPTWWFILILSLEETRHSKKTFDLTLILVQSGHADIDVLILTLTLVNISSSLIKRLNVIRSH